MNENQEPVAWMTSDVTNGDLLHFDKRKALRFSDNPEPLYTSPQQSSINQSLMLDFIAGCKNLPSNVITLEQAKTALNLIKTRAKQLLQKMD